MRRVCEFDVAWDSVEAIARRMSFSEIMARVAEICRIRELVPAHVYTAANTAVGSIRDSSFGQELAASAILVAVDRLRDFLPGQESCESIFNAATTCRIAVDRMVDRRTFRVVFLFDTPEHIAARTRIEPTLTERRLPAGEPEALLAYNVSLDGFARAANDPQVVIRQEVETVEYEDAHSGGYRHRMVARVNMAASAFGCELSGRLCQNVDSVGFRVMVALLGCAISDHGHSTALGIVTGLEAIARDFPSICVRVENDALSDRLRVSFYGIRSSTLVAQDSTLVAATMPASGWPDAALRREPNILRGIMEPLLYRPGEIVRPNPNITVGSQKGGNSAHSHSQKKASRPVRRLKLNRNNEEEINVPHDQYLQLTNHLDQRLARRRRGTSLQWYVDPDEG